MNKKRNVEYLFLSTLFRGNTPVAQEAIEHIVVSEKLKLNCLLEIYNMQLIDKIKSLISLIMSEYNDEKLGTEVAIAYTLDMIEINRTIGEEKGKVALPKANTDNIVIHNHPNNSWLSYDDLDTFSKYRNIKALISIGHDGGICIIERDKHTDEQSFMVLIQRINRKYSSEKNLEEKYKAQSIKYKIIEEDQKMLKLYEDYRNERLKEGKKYGFNYQYIQGIR